MRDCFSPRRSVDEGRDQVIDLAAAAHRKDAHELLPVVDPVHDPESPDTVLVEALELSTEGLAAIRIGAQ